MRGDNSVAGEGRVVDLPKFHSWGKCTMPLTNIDSLDVQHFLWPVCYLYSFTRVLKVASWGVIIIQAK